MEGKYFEGMDIPKARDTIELLEELVWLREATKVESKIPQLTFGLNAEKLLRNNHHLLLLRKIEELNLGVFESIVFLKALWDLLSHNAFLNVQNELSELVFSNSIRIRFIQSFLNGSNQLLKKDLVKIVNTDNTYHILLTLTQYAKELLSECGLIIDLINTNKEI